MCDSTGCYNLSYLSSVEIQGCCTKYSNVDVFKFTHPSQEIRKAEDTVQNKSQENKVVAQVTSAWTFTSPQQHQPKY